MPSICRCKSASSSAGSKTLVVACACGVVTMEEARCALDCGGGGGGLPAVAVDAGVNDVDGAGVIWSPSFMPAGRVPYALPAVDDRLLGGGGRAGDSACLPVGAIVFDVADSPFAPGCGCAGVPVPFVTSASACSSSSASSALISSSSSCWDDLRGACTPIGAALACVCVCAVAEERRGGAGGGCAFAPDVAAVAVLVRADNAAALPFC